MPVGSAGAYCARVKRLLPLLSLVSACAGPADSAPAATDTAADTAGDTAGDAAPPTLAFRFAVLADPHVYADASENLDRLQRAVAWIEAEREARDLRLVLVVGDSAWGEGLAPARAALDALTIPYVPINGDNEVQSGWEEAYATTFADHYQRLAGELDGFVLAPVEVENPEVGVTSWFHNLAFDYGGLHFVGLDWASRVMNPILGEMGYLHDFPGGTFPFFAEALAARAGGAREHVVLFSHIPMHLSPGGFDLDQLAQVTAVTAPLADVVWADLAGHYHGNGEETVPDAGYDLHVTDAVWDDELSVRLVEVWTDGEGFRPTTEVVVIDTD